MKTFQNYARALSAACGAPILRIRDWPAGNSLYVVLDTTDPSEIGLHELAVIDATGTTTGYALVQHLDRLGNAARATPDAYNASPDRRYALPDNQRRAAGTAPAARADTEATTDRHATSHADARQDAAHERRAEARAEAAHERRAEARHERRS